MITEKRYQGNIVLCYHGCALTPSGIGRFISTLADWQSQINKLKDQGYTFVKPSQFYDWYMGTWDPGCPIACVTIDDGYDNIYPACDWMISQGIPFSLALITGRQRVRRPEVGFLPWTKAKEYFATPYAEFQFHTDNIHHFSLICYNGVVADGIEDAAVLAGPCWIPDGDIPYKALGDTRWYWDFTRFEDAAQGMPLLGSDPGVNFTVPLTVNMMFKARSSYTCNQIRAWGAKQVGTAYKANVKVRIANASTYMPVIPSSYHNALTSWFSAIGNGAVKKIVWIGDQTTAYAPGLYSGFNAAVCNNNLIPNLEFMNRGVEYGTSIQFAANSLPFNTPANCYADAGDVYILSYGLIEFASLNYDPSTIAGYIQSDVTSIKAAVPNATIILREPNIYLNTSGYVTDNPIVPVTWTSSPGIGTVILGYQADGVTYTGQAQVAQVNGSEFVCFNLTGSFVVGGKIKQGVTTIATVTGATWYQTVQQRVDKIKAVYDSLAATYPDNAGAITTKVMVWRSGGLFGYTAVSSHSLMADQINPNWDGHFAIGQALGNILKATSWTTPSFTDVGTIPIGPESGGSTWINNGWVHFPIADYSIINGQSYIIQFATQNTGPGFYYMYAGPETLGENAVMTSVTSTVIGVIGSRGIDNPPTRVWPTSPCIILSNVGTAATFAQYQDYIQEDITRGFDAINKYLNPIWSEVWQPGNLADQTESFLFAVALYGTMGDGTKCRTVVTYIPESTGRIECLRFKLAFRRGRSYYCVVDVYMGSSPTGPFTLKVSTFLARWVENDWEEIDLDRSLTINVTANVPVYFQFVTRHQSNEDYYPLPGSAEPGIDAHMRQFGTKVGFARLLVKGPTLNRYNDGSNNPIVEIDGINYPVPAIPYSNPDIGTAPEGAPWNYKVAAYPRVLDGSNSWPRFVFGLPWIYHDDKRQYGRAFFTAMRRTDVAPIQFPNQVVYPYGFFNEQSHYKPSIRTVNDVSAPLKEVFVDNGFEAGYTVVTHRVRPITVRSEPNCRCTQWTIPRMSILGNVPNATTLRHFDLYTGLDYPDVDHSGLVWHISMEPDPDGNATVVTNVETLTYIAMDAYFFDGIGGIEKGRLNDGSWYVDVADWVGSFSPGDIVTGPGGWAAIVSWASEIVWEMKLALPTGGPLSPGDVITCVATGSTIQVGDDTVIFYADDKGWLQERGKSCLLIINNNLASGTPDPDIGSHVVNNPSVYIPKIVSLLVEQNWDGVVCNLEAVPEVDRDAATAFYQALGPAVHAVGKIVQCTAPGYSDDTLYPDQTPEWYGWCDHAAIIPYVDGMKILSYTEAGEFSAPGPQCPDYFFNDIYSYLDRILPARMKKRIIVGVGQYGSDWYNYPAVPDALYMDFHTFVINTIIAGVPIIESDSQLHAQSGNDHMWVGNVKTVHRAINMAKKYGFLGISIWKADDGDMYETIPQHSTLHPVKSPWRIK